MGAPNKELGWHTDREIIQMETLSMVFKSINDLAPTYLAEMFTNCSDTDNYVILDSIWNFPCENLQIAKKVSHIEEQKCGIVSA